MALVVMLFFWRVSEGTATFLREKSPKRLCEKLRFSSFGDVVAVLGWGAPEGAVKSKRE